MLFKLYLSDISNPLSNYMLIFLNCGILMYFMHIQIFIKLIFYLSFVLYPFVTIFSDFQQKALSFLADIQTQNFQILSFNKKKCNREPDNTRKLTIIFIENLGSFLVLKNCLRRINQSVYGNNVFNTNILNKVGIIFTLWVRKLAALGGNRISDETFYKIFTVKSIGGQFSWKGRHRKSELETTSVMEVVYDI